MSGTPIDLSTVLDYYGVDPGKRMASCPFHDDRTPSLSINTDKGVYNCHSCGRHGDGWTMIQEKEGLDFVGARQWAESTLGVTAGDAGGGDIVVSGPAHARRSGAGVSRRKGNRPAGGAYRPSWRRG